MEIRNESSSAYFKETLTRCGIVLKDFSFLSTSALSLSTATATSSSIIQSSQNLTSTLTVSQYLQHLPSIAISPPQCREPIRAMRQLDAMLRQHVSRLEQFIQSMKFYFHDYVHLKLCLMNFDEQNYHQHQHQQQSQSMNSFYNPNDTILRILMRIETIQQPLVRLLIDKMITLSSEMNDEDDNYQELYHFILQIFNHIRWCDDVIFDSAMVVTSLLESVQVMFCDYLTNISLSFLGTPKGITN
jgi:hypothetical protein